MGRDWRLILDGDHSAAFNMAVDEAIMCTCANGQCPPTLRLYGWERPAVSLGYFQDLDEQSFDLRYCEKTGIDIVRRLTGGRAVLHGHDLTFSVVIREDKLPHDSRSVLDSHRWLVGGVLAALRNMGLDGRLGAARGGKRARQSAGCFAHVAPCDVVIRGRKAAGSAQVRKLGVVLEQGSIPFCHPEVEVTALFLDKYRGSNEVSVFPDGLTRETLENAVVRGFREALGIPLVVGTFLDTELLGAANLKASKFGTKEWTLRRQSTNVDNSKWLCYTP